MDEPTKLTSPESGAETPKPAPKVRAHIVSLLKLRLWLEEHFRPTELQVTLMWAGLVGFLGGMTSLLFRAATDGIHVLLTQHNEPLVESFKNMPPWQRFVTP